MLCLIGPKTGISQPLNHDSRLAWVQMLEAIEPESQCGRDGADKGDGHSQTDLV